MPYNSAHFATALKVKRAERGWNQQQLADASGLAKDTISFYESERSNPTFESVCKIADACGCSIDDFRDTNDRVS